MSCNVIVEILGFIFRQAVKTRLLKIVEKYDVISLLVLVRLNFA